MDTKHINKITLKYEPTILCHRAVTSSEVAWQVAKQLWDDDWYRESFMVLHLNRANMVINTHTISKGGVFRAVVCNRLIFSAAITDMANAIILVHNHPSEKLQPSTDDMELTKNLCKIGEILKMPVLDHIIITKDKFLSMADEGYIYF